MNRNKKIATALLVVVFLSPIAGTLLSAIGQTAETNQYAGLMWLVMGVYNLPFFLVSLIATVLGGIFLNKQRISTADKAFMLSIASSIVGTILMLAWGLGIFS